MQAIEQAQTPVSAITWLNMSGDVTITWDDANREAIIALVKEKMAAGYSFFIITPRFFPILGNKQVKLTDEQQLEKALGVVVPDSQMAEVAAKLGTVGDEAIDKVVQSGQAQIAHAPKAKMDSTRRAKSAEEVVRHQSVAVRPIVAG